MFVLLEKPLNRLPEIIRKQKLVPYRIFNVEPLTYIYIYIEWEREKNEQMFLKFNWTKQPPPPFFPLKNIIQEGQKNEGIDWPFERLYLFP